MQAFEFNTKITDGIIRIPEIRNLRSDQKVKVILLITDEPDFQEKLLSEQAEKQESCKNEEAVNLLHSWMSDESGYDESAWDDLKKNIEKTDFRKGKDLMTKPEKRKVEDVFKDIRGHVKYYDDILKPETDEWSET
ncbi:MAG: hypothetical protein GY749_33960 [Desulfobacteraceae bacterium]|nr:hypothetical protein [Desulfobacteraceae bacterium]